MKTPDRIKNDKIAHLEYCFETLMRKDNGDNTIEVERLGKVLWNVICEMKSREALEALNYFENSIDENLRKILLHFNIELMG